MGIFILICIAVALLSVGLIVYPVAYRAGQINAWTRKPKPFYVRVKK